MKRLLYFGIIIAQLLLVACGDSSEFRVAGEIAGMGTQNLRIFYYADGAVHSVTSAALDGKFRFAGQSAKPAIVEIFSSNRTLIGRVIVKNGEELDCRFDKDNRYNVSVAGNPTASEWAKFLTENADALASPDDSLANGVIAGYVNRHRDNILSTVLMLTEFRLPGNELLADSLMRLISPQASPDNLAEGFRAQLAAMVSDAARGDIFPMNLYCAGDSLYGFNPACSRLSVLYFSSSGDSSSDSVRSAFGKWRKDYKPRQLGIVDISLDFDTASWNRYVQKDNHSWMQCWAQGSVAARSIERLAIPRTPYFIVADSLGRQLYRGMSLDDVKVIVNDSLAVNR